MKNQHDHTIPIGMSRGPTGVGGTDEKQHKQNTSYVTNEKIILYILDCGGFGGSSMGNDNNDNIGRLLQ